MSSTSDPVDPRELTVRTSTIYSDDGHTRIPDAVKEAMDINKGDKLKYIIEDGEMYVFILRED